MALLLSADFHQGNEIFNFYSRGRQCAFMTLSALLTVLSVQPEIFHYPRGRR